MEKITAEASCTIRLEITWKLCVGKRRFGRDRGLLHEGNALPESVGGAIGIENELLYLLCMQLLNAVLLCCG